MVIKIMIVMRRRMVVMLADVPIDFIAFADHDNDMQ